MAGATLLIVYVATLAPGVTFWDAGELIAAANGLGIPHPPGTPLYVAIGRVWIVVSGGVLGAARAMNLLSAVATALAGGATAWLVARRSSAAHAGWSGLAAALAAGTMMSAWANATETEVYAISLLHAVAMLVTAAKVELSASPRDERWLLATAYLMALAPALHLSALVAAPAAIVLAGRSSIAGPLRVWRWDRVTLLGGVLVATAGVGRADWRLVVVGIAMVLARTLWERKLDAPTALSAVVLVALGASALAILLVRARHDPTINQGNPSSLAALADVIGRRQYAVASMLPRQTAVWWQAANLVQYVDWQAAMSWGDGLMTSPARVIAALVWLALAWAGHRALRRDAPALAESVAVLFVCGTAGVAAYLNLRMGASLGWGFVPDGTIHEARERDYFFVLGFWAWGVMAGYGAVSLARSRGWAPAAGLAAVLLPLAGNWPSADRAHGPEGSAAREVAQALLESAPPRAVIFLDGDNDTYPVWYLQAVEGVRRDVQPVTIPLLPAAWYPAEIARRTGLQWDPKRPVQGATTRTEQVAALIAAAARTAGRPVVASPAIPARERAMLGADWVMRGPVYVARSVGTGEASTTTIDTAAAMRWLERAPAARHESTPPGDDVAWAMLSLLQCPRLATPGVAGARRDSLEVRCNLR
ncbi:MAG: DUF2723 domain-containing protein [bacterium]